LNKLPSEKLIDEGRKGLNKLSSQERDIDTKQRRGRIISVNKLPSGEKRIDNKPQIPSTNVTDYDYERAELVLGKWITDAGLAETEVLKQLTMSIINALYVKQKIGIDGVKEVLARVAKLTSQAKIIDKEMLGEKEALGEKQMFLWRRQQKLKNFWSHNSICMWRTPSNIFVALMDPQRNLIQCRTSGSSGIKGRKRLKRAPQAIEQIMGKLYPFFRSRKIKEVMVVLRTRVNAYVRILFKELAYYGIRVHKILVRRKVAFNGCRKAVRRRI
jgi:ribosomal protein S11